MINPEHYKKLDKETIILMQEIMDKEQFEGYLLGNIIKYLSRYKHKNKEEDLQKALIYNLFLLNHFTGKDIKRGQQDIERIIA